MQAPQCTDRRAPQGLDVSLVGDLERQLYLSVARAVIAGGAHTAGAPISPAGQEDQEAPTPLTQHPWPTPGPLPQAPQPLWDSWVRDGGACTHKSP